MLHAPSAPSPLTKELRSGSRQSSPASSRSAKSVVVNAEPSSSSSSPLSYSQTSETLRCREVLRYFTPPSPPSPPSSPAIPARPSSSNGNAAALPEALLLDSDWTDKNPRAEPATDIKLSKFLKSSDDTALTAFAQLLAIKLDCERSMISIIDKSNQYIIAEATRTMPIMTQLHQSSRVTPDGLWLGCEMIPRENGICTDTLHLQQPPLTSTRKAEVPTTGGAFVHTGAKMETFSWDDDGEVETHAILEVHDLTLDPRYKDREFVVDYPYLRFYAGTPLRTGAGFNIGTLCVVDSMPRRLTMDEKRTLGRLGEVVMQHLELSAERRALRRTQRMAESFGLFVARKYSFLDDEDYMAHLPSATAAPEQREPERPYAMRRGMSFSSSASDSSMAVADHESISETFARGSILVRKALDLDGTAFVNADEGFDAVPGASRRQTDAAHRAGLLGWSGKLDKLDGDVPPVDLLRAQAGADTAGEAGFKQECPTPPGIGAMPSESIIERLLEMYPSGTILSYDDLTPGSRQPIPNGDEFPFPCSPTLHDEDTVYSAIRDFLPGCTAVVCVPLTRVDGKPYAFAFAWTRDRRRVLVADELQYMRAFGRATMGEIARINAMSADAAKGAFIGSVSHELRSPLHGVLASAEFLRETQLDAFQLSLANTVDSCGRMVLGTINSVLDFSKLGTLVKDHRARRIGDVPEAEGQRKRRTRNGAVSIVEDTDVSLLTEQVIEAVYAGFEFQGISSPGLTEAQGEGVSAAARASLTSWSRTAVQSTSNDVTVIVDVQKRDNWIFATQPGALRRILMNIFGNSLKYTASGWIRVELQAEDLPLPSEQPMSKVVLSITDSGTGMGRDFLKGRLFTPFSQENPLANGTGLGMSIVRQLVELLDGDIDVRSREGVGTKVVISLTLPHCSSASPRLTSDVDLEEKDQVAKTRSLTEGKTLSLYGFDSLPFSSPSVAESPYNKDTDIPFHSEVALGSLRDSLAQCAKEWYGMTVISEPLYTKNADVILANECVDLLSHLDTLQTVDGSRVPLVVLCSSVGRYKTYAPQAESGHVIDFISRPCGPFKLGRTLRFCFEQSLSRAVQDVQSSPTEPPNNAARGAVRITPSVRSGASTSDPLLYLPGQGLLPTEFSSSASPRPPFVGGSRPGNTADRVARERAYSQADVVQNCRPDDAPGTALSTTMSALDLSAERGEASGASERESTPQVDLSRPFTASLAQSSTTVLPPGASEAVSSRSALPAVETYPHGPGVLVSSNSSAPSSSRGDSPEPLTEWRRHRSIPIPNFLIVEDNYINLMLLATFLKKRQLPFAKAENGYLGLQAVQNTPTPFDIIFMDLQMPVMSGIDATRHIRKFENDAGAGTHRSLIIALTGLAGSENMDEAFDAGVDLFLTKPVSFRRIKEEIELWTRRKLGLAEVVHSHAPNAAAGAHNRSSDVGDTDGSHPL